jgi:acetate kinase
MRVLTLNCGSSTLKFDVLDVLSRSEGNMSRVAGGVVERIGGTTATGLSVAENRWESRKPAVDHATAFDLAAGMLEEAGLLAGLGAVGHRVVHGGVRFREPKLISDEVIEAIQAAGDLAPLHNGPALAVIRAAASRFGEEMPMAATFDTAYYASLPEVAARYALPAELSDRLGIRRFGFHGLAHRYMVEQYRVLRPGSSQPRLITLQLGNGCSVTASKDGIPVDTSMGFTPLEGLIMGTRSGDLDPSIPLLLVERQGMPATDVEALLNNRSGLLGLSGRTNDMRDLLAAARRGDADSDLAVRAFCYRAKKYLGAYLAVLGGADAVIFGGGIGQNIPQIRESICDGFEWAGLEIDSTRNRAALQSDQPISSDTSKIEALVIQVDEAVVIARDLMDLLQNRNTMPA